MNPATAVAFDFGNVLVSFDHMRACRALAGHSALAPERIYQLIFSSGLEARYDTGGLSSLAFFEEVTRLVGAHHLDYAKFGQLWSDIFTPVPGLEDLVARVAGRYGSFLASNTNEIHWNRIRHMPIVGPLAARAVLSFRIGARKPDREFFAELLRRAAVPASDILFLDDITENVTAAQAVGLRAIQYNCNTMSCDVLCRLLSDHGILVYG